MANAQPVFIDPADAAGFKRGIFNAIVAPRPIGWISTLDDAGRANLAPFSYFNIVSNLPPILMFSCNTPEDRLAKDTLSNVRLSGEFVFNVATWELREQMNRSSSTVARHVDEFELAGLTKAPSRAVRPPRVAESPLSLECRVVAIIDLPACPISGLCNTATFGEVVGVHIDPHVIHDGMIDTSRYRPLARLGYLDYATCGEIFEMQRPGSPR